MIRQEINNINRIIASLKETQDQQRRRARELKQYESIRLNYRRNQNGDIYYFTRKSGSIKPSYLGNASCEIVNNIKEARYLKHSLSIIEEDIRCLEKALSKLHAVDYDSVNALLPKLYRDAKLTYARPDDVKHREWKEQALAFKSRFNIYRPEELKIETKDGTCVRSKSEALIYNALLDLGLTFIYEMPIRIGNRTYWADFVILSEQDNETEIIIEHQGLMNSEGYRVRFMEKLHGYWKAGYILGVNIFFTFDNPDGGLDLTPVYDAVNNHVKRA